MSSKLFPLRYSLAWKGLRDLGPSKQYWPVANWGPFFDRSQLVCTHGA